MQRIWSGVLALWLAGAAQAQDDQGARAQQAAARSQQQAARAEMAAQKAAMDAQGASMRAGAAAQAGRLAELSALGAAAGAFPGAGRKPTEQEELAMTALEGLMGAPPERALPLVKRVLEGKQSDLVKSRALFVLSQIDLPEAQALLIGVARQQSGALRSEAIRMIGVSGDAKSLSALKDLYAAGDAQSREDIRGAYLIADRKQELLELALKAKDAEELDALVRTLGAMGAVEELRKLGDAGKQSGGLVQAYAIAGDLASLRKLAAATDPEVRQAAISNIGIIDQPEARQALREIYRSAQDEAARQAALQGMMIAGDSQGLLELYRSSSKPEEKRALLRTLTLTGGDEAMQAIDAALQGQQP